MNIFGNAYKTFRLVTFTFLLFALSDLSIGSRQNPTTLKISYSVEAGQAAMALGTSSIQYKQLTLDAGFCSNWQTMVNSANSNNARKGISRRYGLISYFNPFTWQRVYTGFTANF